MERLGMEMNGISYSSLVGNTGLFSNQTVSTEEALFKGAAAKSNSKAEDNKQSSVDSDTYEYSGQARSVKAGYDKPKRTEQKTYKEIGSDGIQEGVKLSDAAKNLLKELQEKYTNMDIAVAEWSSDEEQDYYASKTSKDYSVLINPELLEEMAADESVREQYESVLSGAGEKFDTLTEELGEDADKVKGFSITIDKDGTVSYAVRLLKDMEESNKAQKKNSTTKTQEERIEEKRAERKQAEEERQERIIEKREETEKISAGSIEELIAAIKAKLHPEETAETDAVDVAVTAAGQAATE